MDTRKKLKLRKRRHQRLRKKIQGTSDRPRVAVFKSLKQFYAQAIDDTSGTTLAAASSLTPELKGEGGNVNTAVKVADLLASKAKEAGISRIVLDHGGFGYKGKIKAFADQLRKQGLEF